MWPQSRDALLSTQPTIEQAVGMLGAVTPNVDVHRFVAVATVEEAPDGYRNHATRASIPRRPDYDPVTSNGTTDFRFSDPVSGFPTGHIAIVRRTRVNHPRAATSHRQRRRPGLSQLPDCPGHPGLPGFPKACGVSSCAPGRRRSRRRSARSAGVRPRECAPDRCGPRSLLARPRDRPLDRCRSTGCL